MHPKLPARRWLSRVMDLQTKAPDNQALHEFEKVRGAIGAQGMLALFDAPWTPIHLACCFRLHPLIGVLTLVGCIVLFILAWLNERDTRPRLDKAIQSQNNAYSAQEKIAGQSEIVRTLGMRQSSIARQIHQRQHATAAQADAQLAGGRYSGAIKFLRLVMQSAALGLAAYLPVKGDITPARSSRRGPAQPRGRPDRTGGRGLGQLDARRRKLVEPDRSVLQHAQLGQHNPARRGG